MANICKTVNPYTRKIKKGTMLSFFLDYYPGYRDETTNKVMRHESLSIYIYAHPKTQREKEYNARLTEKAEAMRCRRYEEIVNERYDFFDKNKLNGSFIDYSKTHAAKKNSRYEQAFIHFNRFVGGKCSFGEVTKVGVSAEELIVLAETPCEEPALKNAFLFACLTGLRKSDIKTLTWEMIQP